MAANNGFSMDQIRYRRMRFDYTDAGFSCPKADFEEYFAVTSTHDQQERVGRPYVFVRNGHIVGYTVLAADRPDEEQSRPDAGTLGRIPALDKPPGSRQAL